MDRQKILARVIIQMMGSPKKHIVDTLKMYVDKIEDDYKDIKIRDEFKSKPKKEGNMYQVFTELEIEVSGVDKLVYFCFDYMPSSVEILEPEELVYDSKDLTDYLNDLQERLHKADMMIKNLSAENQVVKNNGVTLMKNIILLQLKWRPTDIETLAINAGVPEEHIKKFLGALEKDGKIKKDKGIYSIV